MPATADTAEDRLWLPGADDWHIHLREGPALERTLTDAGRSFRRLVAMPNLDVPLTEVALAAAYRRQMQQVLAEILPDGPAPELLIPLYLTDDTSVATLDRAAETDWICGAKLYPAGATTRSDAGIADLSGLDPILAEMEKRDLPLLVHAEVTAPDVDIFDREKLFIDRHLKPWSERFPALRIVVEHLSSAHAVDFVLAARPGVAATITAHHLLLNRNDLLAGGLRPHAYCLPVAKRETDRLALLQAATSGNPRFFLGTDSAPHSRGDKESACGCAGIYTAHAALELYAEAFERAGALHRLSAFACEHGARFYRRPTETGQQGLVLQKNRWQVPDSLPFADGELVPFAAGQTLSWQLQRAAT